MTDDDDDDDDSDAARDHDGDPERWARADIRAEFAALFPHGWAGADVLAELAPGGWVASPLVRVFHPTAAQVYEETIRMTRNMANLFRRPDAPPPPPEPTLPEIEAEHEEGEVAAERECQELVGQALWDVFSDNHDVLGADGRKLDLGSARAGGGFLADVVNAQGGPVPLPKPVPEGFLERMTGGGPVTPELAAAVAQMAKEMYGDGGYTYLDFYLGTRMVADRADLRPVYEMIFRRLRARGLDWAYTFPRLYLVDFRGAAKAAAATDGEPEFAGYDPSAAFEEEEKDRRRDEEIAATREKLDEDHREAVAAAQDAEPPATVQAYAAVYGEFPRGWPPEA